MIETITGYVPNSELTFNVLKKLGFKSQSKNFEAGSDYLILEKGHIWFVELIYEKGRFFNKELSLAGVFQLINEGIDLDNSCCEANIGTMSYLSYLGFKPDSLFSDNTKFFIFNNEDKTFSGVNHVSYSEKRKLKLIEGKFINEGEPIYSASKIEELLNQTQKELLNEQN